MRRKAFIKEGIKVKPSVKKMLLCSRCREVEEKVYDDVESVICHICVVHMGPAMTTRIEQPTETRRMKGWKFMKVYVDQEGSVYHKGVEQPELKGTLPVTTERPKKSRFEREQIKAKKEQRLADRHAKKMERAKKEEEKKQKDLDEKMSDL